MILCHMIDYYENPRLARALEEKVTALTEQLHRIKKELNEFYDLGVYTGNVKEIVQASNYYNMMTRDIIGNENLQGAWDHFITMYRIIYPEREI